MISKNELKYYSSLLQKKFRTLESKFIAEGKKIVEEGINSNYECEIVFVTNDFNGKEQDFVDSIKGKVKRFEIIKSTEFSKLTETKSPQGIAGVFSTSNKIQNELSKINSPKIVCLENISDPGNLGTIIRTCDWFGFQNLILSKDSVELFNPKAVRSSMGSVFHLNIYENIDLIKGLSSFKKKGYKFLCADLNGDNVFNYDFPDKYILFFCNEASGPSNELLSIIDNSITIPKLGKAESLNISAAAAIILSIISK